MSAAILVLAASLQAAPLVQIRPPSAAQGDIVTLEVARAGEPEPPRFATGADKSGRAAPYHFFASGDRYLALVGIDAEAKPGSMPVEVYADGSEARLSIGVKAKKFPTERLTVEPKYVEPPAEVTARIVAEKERLDQLWLVTGAERLWQQRFIRPIESVPNSSFGLQRVFNGQRRSPHNGVDFPAEAGLPVHAANAGRVVVAEELYFTGNTVVVDHGLGLYTVYAHLSAFDARPGEAVERGQIVGRVGSTGRATGPHLHWGARLLEARVDPMQLLQVEQEEGNGNHGR